MRTPLHINVYYHNCFIQAYTELGQRVFLNIYQDLTINTLGNLKGHQCSAENNLMYDILLYNRIAKENEKYFNCSVPFHPPIYSDVTGTDVKICNNNETGRLAYKNFKEMLGPGVLPPEETPCAEFDIFLSLPDIDIEDNNNDEGYIRLHLPLKIKLKSIVLYYDSYTFAAEIGGCIGMLLGISLVDLSTMIYSALRKTLKVRKGLKRINIEYKKYGKERKTSQNGVERTEPPSPAMVKTA